MCFNASAEPKRCSPLQQNSKNKLASKFKIVNPTKSIKATHGT